MQVDPERQPVEQRRGRPLLVAVAFVERDDPDPRGLAERKPVALGADDAEIQRLDDARGDAGRDALRHREQNDAAVGFRQQSGFGDRPPRAQGRREVEAAEQAIVGNAERRAPPRRLRRQVAAQAPQARRRAPARRPRAARRPKAADRSRTAPAHTRRAARARKDPARPSCPEQFADRAADARRGAGIIERIAAQAMAQRHRRDALEMRVGDRVVALVGGERARGADQRQFAAQAVGAERDAEPRRALQRRIGRLDLLRAPRARRRCACAASGPRAPNVS